jgi:hypothetical protein
LDKFYQITTKSATETFPKIFFDLNTPFVPGTGRWPRREQGADHAEYGRAPVKHERERALFQANLRGVWIEEELSLINTVVISFYL